MVNVPLSHDLFSSLAAVERLFSSAGAEHYLPNTVQYLVFCFIFELRNSSFDARSRFLRNAVFFFCVCKVIEGRTTILRYALTRY